MQEQARSPHTAVSNLHVLVQTPDEWSAWTDCLASALATDSAAGQTAARRWHVALTRLPATVGEAQAAAASSRTRWVVFVDSPARYLAARLQAGPQAEAQALLAAWQRSASQTLAFIHAQRNQCVAFDSDETASNPSAVAVWLSGWLGEDLPEEPWPIAPAAKGLLATLAAEFVQADRRASALWSELQACCSPLPGTSGQSQSPVTQPLNLANLLAEAQALVAANARVPVLEAAQSGLREQLEGAARRLSELESLREQALRATQVLEADLRAERERSAQARQTAERSLNEQAERTRAAEAQANEARAEAELLLAQLHQVQEDLESLFLRQQDTGKSLAAAKTELKSAQHDLATARQQLQAEQQRVVALDSESKVVSERMQNALQKEKAGLEASLGAERAANTQAEAARKQLEAEYQKTKTALEAEAEEAKEEADLLLVQLHYVQEELETHFLALQSANQDLAAARAAAEAAHGHRDGLGFRVLARSCEVTAAHTARPHCELDLRFSDVTLGAVKLERADVRLIEHEGRAGLALIALADLPRPITQWAPDGEDGRGAYMLFIPADAQGRERLAALGTLNWQTLRGLAALAQQAAEDAATPESAFWQSVSGRLCAALDVFPARLRYDAMTVQQAGQAIAVRLEGVCFGSRSLPPVALNWTPDSRETPLKLLRTDERAPCLAAWPVGADGMLAAELVLPVAKAGALGNRLRWWGQLLPADRDLVLAIVDTLAAVPALLPAGTDEAQRRHWAAQAARLRSRLLRSLNLARWARRLRHSLRGH